MVRSCGPDAVEMAASCGLILDDWQAEELYWSLGQLKDGSWAAKEYLLICSRQNGKNVIVEARELYGLFVLGERILHTAHEFDTAKESYNALMAMIEANPTLRRQLVGKPHASVATGYDMRTRKGGLIQYKARTLKSGRGFRGVDLLVFDEAQGMNEGHQGALLPTISTKANAQAWYQGSAPLIDSVVLHRHRAALRSGTMNGAEYSADPDADLDDPVEQRRANPNLRVTMETIATERRTMSDEQFATERLSISPDPLEAGGPFGPAWAACCDENILLQTPKAFGIDVSPDRDWSAIVACGDDPATISVVDYLPGTEWVVARCKELKAKYRLPFALDAKAGAGALIEDLKKSRIRLIELDATEMTRASGAFFDAIQQKTVKIRTDLELDRAVSGAEKRPVGDTWAWGRKHSRCDITLLVAANVAWWARGRKRASIVAMTSLLCPTCGELKADCPHTEESDV